MKNRISLVALIFSLGLAYALVAQSAATGSLWVHAEPGIQIFLDGKLQGVTKAEAGGLLLQDVPAGSHSLKAVKEGFAAKTLTFSLKAGEAKVVQLPKFTASSKSKGAQSAPPPPPTVLYVFLPETRLSADIQISLDNQVIGAISKTAPCVKQEISAGDHAAVGEIKPQQAAGKTGRVKKFAAGATGGPPAPPKTLNFRSATEEKLYLKIETGLFAEDGLEMGMAPEAEAKNFVENCPAAGPPQPPAPATPEPAKQQSAPAPAAAQPSSGSETEGLHQPSPGKSLVYIVRPSSVGFAVKFKVSIDGKEIGFTRGGNYLEAELDPGNHEIISSAENSETLTLTAAPGQIYFLEQKPTMGALKARNKLIQLDSEKGKDALSKCKKRD